jgi:hypothetical protein
MSLRFTRKFASGNCEWNLLEVNLINSRFFRYRLELSSTQSDSTDLKSVIHDLERNSITVMLTLSLFYL